MYIFKYQNVHLMDLTGKILTTSGACGRKDHIDLYRQVIEKMDEGSHYNDPDSWGNRYCIHPFLIAKTLIKTFKILKNSGLSIKEKIDLAAESIYYCNTLIELEKLDYSNINKYVCEIDVRRFENLLTQLMQLRGVETFSMAEGLLYIFKGEIPVDSLHYVAITTDKLLCWGQYTIDEYGSYGIDKSRLMLAGYPKKVDIKSMLPTSNLKTCMVLVARTQFNEANMRLLNILKKRTDEYDFYLKLHPSCDYDMYAKFAEENNMYMIEMSKSLDECLKQGEYDWAIAVNTTAYYESLMRGVPCLRFGDESYYLPKGSDDIFVNLQEMDEKLLNLKNKSLSAYQTEVDDILRYTMGIGIDNYKKLLLS